MKLRRVARMKNFMKGFKPSPSLTEAYKNTKVYNIAFGLSNLGEYSRNLELMNEWIDLGDMDNALIFAKRLGRL
jgi:hypothetical protein